MNENKIDRKIAVIFVTDVVGFSKLMEKNEDQTLKSFRSCREILDNLFKEHGGRILIQPETRSLQNFKVQFLQWFVHLNFKS